MCTKILMESIVATTDSVVNMAITSLQQLIRWSIWPLHRCNKRFGGQYGPLHRCNNSFGGQYGHYIVAANDSVVNMAFYIAATTDSVVNMAFYIVTTTHSVINMSFYIAAATCFHKQSSYFADKMNFLKKSLAPFSLF